jgi:LCP family protein required for cell wall assembly
VTLTTFAVGGILWATRTLSDNIQTIDISDIAAPSFSTSPPPSDKPLLPSAPPLNILLMGSDSRQGENHAYGDPSVHSSARSDTTILLHISGDRTWAAAISFPRDTWTMLPECKTPWGGTAGGYEGKFNAAYQYGGPKCTIRLVQDMTGIKIDHFAVVDFTGFKRVVDTFGGVRICLPQPVADKSSNLMLPAGESLLTGEQALAFVRARKQLSDGSDIARIGRQQQFLHSFADQVLSAGILIDPARLYRVLDAATRSLTTDTGLGNVPALVSLAAEVNGIPRNRIYFSTVPWAPRGDGENVVVDKSRANLVWASLRADLRPQRDKGDRPSGAGGRPESQQLICP